MTTEEWRPIAGFDKYRVSSLGRVVSYVRREPRELKGGDAGRNPRYRLVILYDADRQFVRRKVHVLVCEAFHGPRPDGMVVRHLDGDTSNNAASNLRWGSASENARDQVEHGSHSQARKTHCPSSHAYSPDNTLVRTTGARSCRTCGRRHTAEYKQRQMLRAAGIAA